MPGRRNADRTRAMPGGTRINHGAALSPDTGRGTADTARAGPQLNHTEWGSYMRFRLGGIGPEHPGARLSRWVSSLTGLRGWVGTGSVAVALVLSLAGAAVA